MLLVAQLKHKMVGQGGHGIGQILLEPLFGSGTDLVTGHFGVQAADHGTKAVLDGNGFQLGMDSLAVLGEHLVACQQDGGNAHHGTGPAVQQELRADHAVEADRGGLGGFGVGQGIAVAAGGRVITDEHGSVSCGEFG